MVSFKKPNLILCLTALTWLSLGFLVLGSVSATLSIEKFGDPAYLLRHQFFYGLLPGLALCFFFFFLPREILKKISLWFFLATLFLAGLLLVSKIGLKFLGASRWLNLGVVVFQPAELLKLSSILYLSSWFAGHKPTEKIKSRFGRLMPLLPLLLIASIITVLLAAQPDIGTLSIVLLTAAAIFFLAPTPLWQNFLLWASGAAGLALLIRLAPYRLNRLMIFLHPDIDPMGQGYQLKQSLIAIGAGGLLGVGPGLSEQKFGFLPETIGDAIFPVFAEEWGFLGTALLVSLILIFIWQGLRVSRLARDEFSRLVAAGISLWIGLQALVNICSMSGLLPLIGVPLPFVSYGGSHLVAELTGLGILLNISKEQN